MAKRIGMLAVCVCAGLTASGCCVVKCTIDIAKTPGRIAADAIEGTHEGVDTIVKGAFEGTGLALDGAEECINSVTGGTLGGAKRIVKDSGLNLGETFGGIGDAIGGVFGGAGELVGGAIDGVVEIGTSTGSGAATIIGKGVVKPLLKPLNRGEKCGDCEGCGCCPQAGDDDDDDAAEDAAEGNDNT